MSVKKLSWLILSSLLVLVLLLTSCGTTTTEKTITPTEVKGTVVQPTSTAPTTTKTTTTTTVASDKPKYGGTLNLLQDTTILGFDEGVTSSTAGVATRLTQSRLLMADWARGPAGTGEINLLVRNWKRVEYTIGDMAESFEIPEPGVMIFNIRKGVYYGYNPGSEASKLVNGRQVTTDDVIFGLKRHLTSPTSFLPITQPQASRETTIEKTGEWQITTRTPRLLFDPIWLMLTERDLVPPEVVAKYGNMNDWRNVVGSGPYMLTDYVLNASATCVRNPNYWKTDPVGPGKGNKLPYIDTIKYLIITDVSTQWAALRTHKIDWAWKMEWQESQKMVKSNPELKYQKYLDSDSWPIAMRVDKPELPFANVKVRQALMLAINYDSIKNDLWGGQAEILVWPIAPFQGFEKAYMPMSELPANVKELYSYNVEKAKQLMAEAGYSKGFTTHVITQSTPRYVDPLSVIKDMWAKIGVEMIIEPKEYGVYSSIRVSKNYPEMMVPQVLGPASYAQLLYFNGPSTYNVSYVKEARYEAAYQEIMSKYHLVDQAKVDQIFHDLMPDVLGNAWVIPIPTPYTYVFWTPWVKNYRGEFYSNYNLLTWPMYAWIDQDLKSKITGTK
jgi:peptide/nickel transport system substrate-binding protein